MQIKTIWAADAGQRRLRGRSCPHQPRKPYIHLGLLLLILVHITSAAPIEFSQRNTLDRTLEARRVLAVDLDGDGDNDILGTAFDVNSVIVWENTSTDPLTFIRHAIPMPRPPSDLIAVDIDGDGDLDVVGRNQRWVENNGSDPSTWTVHLLVGVGCPPQAAGDLDGDGDVDVVGAGGTDDVVFVCWFENLGPVDPRWSQHVIKDVPIGGGEVQFASVADLDSDGDNDVFIANEDTGEITWFQNSGTRNPEWTEHTVERLSESPVISFGDVNGDGHLDFFGGPINFATTATNEGLSWWWNDGQQPPTWERRPIDSRIIDTRAIFASDLDSDGDIDVLGSVRPNGERDLRLLWWENSGELSPGWTRHAVDESFGSALAVFAADVDGDGNTDVLGASRDNGIAWWENQSLDKTITGVLDGAASLQKVTPGGTFQVFIAPGVVPETRFATTIPLPTELGLSITVDGTPAPLFGVFRGEDFGVGFDQANGMVPWDTPSGEMASFGVATPESPATSQTGPTLDVEVNAASPGIYTLQFGAGPAIVQNHSDGSFAHAAGSFPGLNTRPAPIGGVITIWANGLGPIDGIVADGDVPGLDNPLLEPTKAVKLFIGGVEARILGSPVLHPTLVALFQINAIVPVGVSPGDEVPIEIEVDCGDGNVFRSRGDVFIAVGPA